MKITRIIISSPVCAHMKANTVIWIGVCNEGRQRWHSNKDRWHISTCFHCTCTANVRFSDKWRTPILTSRPGVCQCAQKKASLKSFSFSSLIQANCGITQRQRKRSRDEHSSNGPSQTSYSPPPSGNCVWLLLSFYLYNLMTAREYQHIRRACLVFTIFFLPAVDQS